MLCVVGKHVNDLAKQVRNFEYASFIPSKNVKGVV
jgi:hypothetical protein